MRKYFSTEKENLLKEANSKFVFFVELEKFFSYNEMA